MKDRVRPLRLLFNYELSCWKQKGCRGLTPFMVLVLFCLGFNFGGSFWHKSNGILEPEINAIAVHPDGQTVYAGTSKAVYKSVDKGKNFVSSFQIPGSDGGVNYIYIGTTEAFSSRGSRYSERYLERQPQGHAKALSCVYVATDSGLFMSSDEGQSWQKIFHQSQKNTRKCLSVMEERKNLYLGTQGGLFIKKAGSLMWEKAEAYFSDSPVFFITQDAGHIYFATDKEVFRMDKAQGTVKKIFTLLLKEASPNGESTERKEIGRFPRGIKALSCSFASPQRLFLATSHGVYASEGKGEQWRRFNADGFPFSQLTSLVVMNPNEMVAGTRRGVFLFHEGTWRPLYQGLETNKVNALSVQPGGYCYAATDRGIFFMALKKALSVEGKPFVSPPQGGVNPRARAMSVSGGISKRQGMDEDEVDLTDILKNFVDEPDILKVQKMAIDYAEVSPEKIKQWRRLAQRRAWLPELDIGLDAAKNRTISDSLWGSYSGGGQHYLGPDDKTFYSNFGWDVSLKWDLGDLVWSTAQTTIDSRSKLMVELREDILNEVTRLYFERRRLQAQLVAGGGHAALESAKETKLDKQIRIAELTALIDALTGGAFSRNIGVRPRELLGSDPNISAFAGSDPNNSIK